MYSRQATDEILIRRKRFARRITTAADTYLGKRKVIPLQARSGPEGG